MSRSGATFIAVLLAYKADWYLRVEPDPTNPVFKLWARDWYDSVMPFSTGDIIDWSTAYKPGVWIKTIIAGYNPYKNAD